MRKPAMVIPMKIELSKQMNRTILRAVMALAAVLLAADVATSAQDALPPVVAPHKLEIERTARPWEFLTSVGKRAGIFGNESGQVEAWVYPLKILRDLKLTILTDNREIPAESLVRTVIARPESTTLVYTDNTFS